MIRWAFLFIFCSASVILVYNNNTVFGQESEAPYLLADLTYEVYPTFSRIILSSNKRIDFVTYELQDPYRIVIDLIGVSFCELEEHVDFREGLVGSVDVIETPYVQRPKGMDEFFYASDYIIITPLAKTPYVISTAEDGKIVLVDIGEKETPQIRVSKVKPLVAPLEKPRPQEEEELEKPEETMEPAGAEAGAGPEVERPPAIVDEPIIDYISYEVLDDGSLVVIVSDKEIEFEVSKRYFPSFAIMLKPKKVVFTELQEKIRLDQGLIKSLKIIKDQTIKRPPALDEYFYPIRYIVVEPTGTLPFDFYSNEDGTISVVDITLPQPEEAIKVAEKAEEVKAEEAMPEKVIAEEVIPEPEQVMPEQVEVKEVVPEQPEVEKVTPERPEAEEVIPEEVKAEEVMPEKEEVEELEEEQPITREEIIRELREELKREGLLRKEKSAEEKLAEEERIKKETERMTEIFDKKAIKELIIKGEGILSLTAAKEIATKNSPVTKTAKEEVDLAGTKMREAFRALFPQMKLKASHTKGDVLDVDFTEEVYGVQAEQPIFQGGRLFNTYKQSKVNQKLAETRLQKIETDLDYKVAEAYYGTVTAIMNVKLQEGLLKEAEEILKIAQNRHRADLSTKLEILNVETQHNQIQFQLASAERDLALARFKLKQAMNLDVSEEEVDLSQVNTELQFKVLDIDLDQCLNKALDNQPEILVDELLVESNLHTERIARGKSDFKVDLTGFYGRSGSHYETEERELDKDWNIGVKVSRPLWGNTASYAFTKEETSRKVGQTDRTGSTVHSGEFAIFDGMPVDSEMKEARVNRKKAEDDLLDTKRHIALEVKEAYYSYQEAIIQVKNSLEKVKFQEEAVKVARAQTELNEALQSQLLEAKIKLADEKAVYIKALSDYNLSLAKLNRAVGLKDYFSME